MVGIGQCSLDHVCQVDGPPEFAGKAPIFAHREEPGGQVATALLACARLGLRACFVGTVGEDAAATRVLAPLREAGIDLSGVRRVERARTQLAVILVDRASGERTVLWHRDPALALRPSDVPREAIATAGALHLDASDPDVAAFAAKLAREAGRPVFLDADTAVPGMAELLAQVDFPIVSRGFARSFFGTDSPREALRGLASFGGRLAVVTLGELGALARQGEQVIESPGFRVAVRDTTGAGDAFHAAFLWAVLAGRGARAALRLANAAAAMNCRALGAQGGLPGRGALERFLAQESPRPWQEP